MTTNRVSLPLHAQRAHGVLPQGAPQSFERKGQRRSGRPLPTASNRAKVVSC